MALQHQGILVSEIEQWVRSTNFITHFITRLRREVGSGLQPTSNTEVADLRKRIIVEETRIRVDQIVINTSNKPLTKKLFEVFLATPDGKQTKSDLIQKIYHENDYNDRSERYKIALQQNLVKLISRARKLMSDVSSVHSPLKNVEWFAFDPTEEAWTLCKDRTKSLSECLREDFGKQLP
ncbi:MAG: hypothetical protein AB7T49_16685 [Oligoflexales bacterium]